MTAIVAVQRSIRRALQARLNQSAIAAGLLISPGVPAIQWKGIAFERDNLANYISVEINVSDVIVHEIGRNPQVEGVGFITAVLHSPIMNGEDANDALLPIMTQAYPYAEPVSFGGVSVNIDKMQHRGYGSDGPWLTGLVSVDWNIYRRE